MSGDIVRQTYEIKCIAPVHIGSGEELRTFEYLYDRDRLEMILLNESKWLGFLETRRLTEAFIQYIELEGQKKKQRNLLEWLRDNRVTMTDLREADVIRRRVPVAMLSDKKNRKPNINKVAVQLVRADNAHPYIPGSTIKGALRTGILYHFIRKAPTRFRPYWEEISAVRGSLKEKGRKWNEIILRLEHEILHTLTADDAASEDAVTSALRGLSVSDAVLVGCVAKAPTIVVQKIDATTLIKSGARRGESQITLFRECIPADSRLRFTITANLPMLRTVGIASLPSLLAMLRTYTIDGLTRQQRVFESIDAKYYGPLFKDIIDFKANALLGGGTGFLSKTLTYTLADQEINARRFIAAYFDEQFTNPAHKHRETDTKISPRTLKRAQTDGADWIMGLCSITEVGNAQML